ncbi:MAG: ABC transporter permease [Ruminiclostridium sp.]|nr:ABC transporter permease [Ruminiclostridium sp.]
MEAFKAALLNEIEKLLRKKKLVAIFAISLVLIVLGQLIVLAVRSQLGLRSASGLNFATLSLSVFANTILPLYTALIAIDMFTGEYSHNTMKIALVCPISRFKLFSAKIAVIAAFIPVNLLIVMILSTVTGLVFATATPTLQEFAGVLASYLVTVLPVLVLAIITVFTANILNSSTAALFLVIISFIAFKALGYVFYQYSSLFATSMLDWYKLWIADRFPLMKILRMFFIMTGYAIMFFMAGYHIFEKRDF